MIDDRFVLNFEWLAMGAGEPREQILIGRDIDEKIPNNWAFSRAFDEFIAPATAALSSRGKTAFEKVIEQSSDANRPFVVEFPRAIGTDKKATVQACAAKIFEAYINQLPPHLYWDFYKRLAATSDDFVKAHAAESSKVSELEAIQEKSGIDTVSINEHNEAVKAQLPTLLKRLKEATRERGKKSELAALLGVSKTRVWQWLSGTNEPGGETTLQLLRWVEQQERQK